MTDTSPTAPSEPADAALRQQGAVGPLRFREADGRPGKILHGRPMEADVVALPPPPAGRRLGGLPGADLLHDDHQRMGRALRPADAQHQVHLRAAAGHPSLPRRQVRRALRLRALDQARHGHVAAHLHARHHQAAAAALLLPWRDLPVLEPGRRIVPFRLPGRGRHLLPRRHRSAGPRHVQPHRLCRAHLAHHRPDRHRAVLHAWR